MTLRFTTRAPLVDELAVFVEEAAGVVAETCARDRARGVAGTLTILTSRAMFEALLGQVFAADVDDYVDPQLVEPELLLHVPCGSSWARHYRLFVMPLDWLPEDLWIAADESSVTCWPPRLDWMLEDHDLEWRYEEELERAAQDEADEWDDEDEDEDEDLDDDDENDDDEDEDDGREDDIVDGPGRRPSAGAQEAQPMTLFDWLVEDVSAPLTDDIRPDPASPSVGGGSAPFAQASYVTSHEIEKAIDELLVEVLPPHRYARSRSGTPEWIFGPDPSQVARRVGDTLDPLVVRAWARIRLAGMDSERARAYVQTQV